MIRIIIASKNPVKIDSVRLGFTKMFKDETVWLTQVQLVDLYQSSKANISEHIKNIFDEGKLLSDTTVRKFRTVQIEGNSEISRETEN